MESLPDELLSNIFMRLRAKQLAQMRCISKYWKALLSQPTFIKSHLDRSLHNKDGILLVWPDLYSSDSRLITAHHSRSPHLELPNFIELPVISQSENSQVIGSVNGLICFRYLPHLNSRVICIWNPSLSAVLTLPPYSVSPHFDNWMTTYFFRFGFDPQTDDYKVVNFTQAIKLGKVGCGTGIVDGNCLQVEVYSMRKGSWKLITQKIPSCVKWIYNQDHISVDGHDGHLHWLGKTELGGSFVNTIVAFDLGAETFREIPLPDSILNHHVSSYYYLGVLAGKLCVMPRVVPFGKCVVWVMEEYGVAESWVKHHVFPPSVGCFKPYGFTSHNELIFRVYQRGLALYDPIAATTKFFEFNGGCDRTGKVVEYVDSLVWVTPDKGA